MATKLKPKHPHNCDRCEILFQEQNGVDYDVYWCPGILGGTILIRQGAEDADYYSVPVSVYLAADHTAIDPYRNKTLQKAVAHLFRDGRLSLAQTTTNETK